MYSGAFLRLAALMVMLMTVTIGTLSAAPGDGIYDPIKEGWLTRQQLLDRAAKADMVLLGEKHDNPAHHRLQLDVLQETISRRDTVVFEMLTVIQQPVIDLFLKGEIAYDQLPKELNWDDSGWPDWNFYGPLMLAAKQAGANILHGNFSRERIQEMMGELRAEATITPLLPDDLFDRLKHDIRLNHCNMLPEEIVAPMSMIQSNRDKLMADQLLAGKESGKGKVFLFAGSGHVRKDRGAPYFLKLENPNLDILAIGFKEEQEGQILEVTQEPFDLLWYTEPAATEASCDAIKKKFSGEDG